METDENVETFTYPPVISSFIRSLFLNKELNIYKGLKEESFLLELMCNSNEALHELHCFILHFPFSRYSFNENLCIKIILNKNNHTLTIIDNGFGMTKTNLIDRLGKINKVEDADWEALQDPETFRVSIILGFHSVYLVADKVTIITKTYDDKQYLWEFITYKSKKCRLNNKSYDTYGYTIRYNNDELFIQGTKVVLHIREDQSEYLEESKIKKMIEKYSAYVEYPIKLIVEKECTEEVSENKIEDKKNESPKKKLKIKNKKKRRKLIVQERSNEVELFPSEPLWMKNSEDIREDDYVEFYKWLSKDCNEYLVYHHMKTLNYTALLFIPKYESNEGSRKYRKIMRCYIRRILVSKNCRLLPAYLNFIIGVINCEDQFINLHYKKLRETVFILDNIAFELIKLIFIFLNSLAKHINYYNMFYAQFSNNIKLGVVLDDFNRGQLMQLLRYYTTASGDEMCSLEDYVSRMKDNQKYIYFIHCNNIIHENIKNNVFVKYVRKHGFEVIYMFDEMDGWIVEYTFKSKEFLSVTTKDLKFFKDIEKKIYEEVKVTKFEKLYRIIIYILRMEVRNVVISNRIINWPCCIVTSPKGWHVEFEDFIDEIHWILPYPHYFISEKYFEINPDHVIIAILEELIVDCAPGSLPPYTYNFIHFIITLLYETALLSYMNLKTPKSYAIGVYWMIETVLVRGRFFSSEAHNNARNRELNNIFTREVNYMNDESIEEVL